MVGLYEGYYGNKCGQFACQHFLKRNFLSAIKKHKLQEHNQSLLSAHERKYDFIASGIKDIDVFLQKLIDFQVAIPSWALGTGGTRFGRFASGGEPRSLEEKIEDVGLLHLLNNSSGAISLHIPW